LLKKSNIKVDLVTGESDRDTQLELFENDELDVLVNMFVLTEGFNMPELKTVFVRDSGELPTIQMCGRVLRPHDDIPVCNIVQSVNTRWPFTRTANIANKQSLLKNNKWKYVSKSEMIDKVIVEVINEMTNAEVNYEMLKKIKALSKSRKKRITV
jgi:superfamily II DNA or RNA helicase